MRGVFRSAVRPNANYQHQSDALEPLVEMAAHDRDWRKASDSGEERRSLRSRIVVMRIPNHSVTTHSQARANCLALRRVSVATRH